MTDAVQVTVLAPPRPAALHCEIPVTGVVEVVLVSPGHTVAPVQVLVTTIEAEPFGTVGVAGL